MSELVVESLELSESNENSKLVSAYSIPFDYGRPITDVNKDDKKIHGGIIEFYEPIPLESILKHPNDLPEENLHFSNNYSRSKILCLMIVPSFMIPSDIIHYFAGSLSIILSIRILRHHGGSNEKYLALIQLSSLESSDEFILSYKGKYLTSLEPTICILYPVKNITLSQTSMTDEIHSLSSMTNDFQSDIRNSPHTPHQTIKKFLSGFDNLVSSPRKVSKSPSVTYSTSATTMRPDTPEYNEEEESYCVVCLDAISRKVPKSFTTCCQHTFHIECTSKLEGPQCPVCRFQHDSTSTELSCCSICGWQGVESFPGMSPTSSGQNMSFTFMPVYEAHRDLWVCLVCGFIGCGASNLSHIQRHYEEHLHTYAMNTDSGRVWDFAGDGYVHRLILSQSDENTNYSDANISSSSNTTASTTASTNTSASFSANTTLPTTVSTSLPIVRSTPVKVVEVSSPLYQSGERSRIAPITQNQEERLVSAKLEAAAYHYNQLVHWQLERNREIYEMRLQRVRDFAKREGQVQPPPGTAGKATWAECVLYLSEQERVKARKQCDTAHARLQKLEEELEVLTQFQRNLEANQIEYQNRITTAKAKLKETEHIYRETIAPLKLQVQQAMAKLDEGG